MIRWPAPTTDPIIVVIANIASSTTAPEHFAERTSVHQDFVHALGELGVTPLRKWWLINGPFIS